MPSDVLTVIIDERKQLENIEDVSFMNRYRSGANQFATRQRVFKDYILSAEPFYVEQGKN